ncbi:hypothetical protein AQUCO_07200035v1 [Aquilegia coerulea]|uniref:proteasome endopeptidase complex n=1 Tax=Aquilegia coerulea TaxID=218851 RepID=A0A2G5CA05_AQUCA|nr:hypothetical protein AQUCO_07200035v1 [Aquilegia coerulea]
MSTKSGTTIVGLVFKDGVVLGSDTRAISSGKNDSEKIHCIAPNIYCCGAGSEADTTAATDMVSSQLQLQQSDPRSGSTDLRVISALAHLKSHVYQQGQGHASSVALVLGGVDITGPHLHSIHPQYGLAENLPFASMGTGSLGAMGMLESRYRQGLTRDEGVRLACDAICAGNMGSGSNVDICVITTKGNKEFLRFLSLYLM